MYLRSAFSKLFFVCQSTNNFIVFRFYCFIFEFYIFILWISKSTLFLWLLHIVRGLSYKLGWTLETVFNWWSIYHNEKRWIYIYIHSSQILYILLVKRIYHNIFLRANYLDVLCLVAEVNIGLCSDPVLEEFIHRI